MTLNNQQQSIVIAKRVFKTNLNVRSGEKVLIVVDTCNRELGEIFFKASEEHGLETMLMQYLPREKSGMEPPKIVAEAMKQADVALCITKTSISHTNARKEAAAHQTRVATMPGLTKDMLLYGALNADYQQVRKDGEALKEILDQGREVIIKTGNQSLSFQIEGRHSKASNGLLRQPGDSGNLPSGETFLAPLEGTANGKILIDGSIAGIGQVTEPIELTINHGKLVAATGNEGKKLLQLLGEGEGRYVGEFGIGTNQSARITGNILEDEKAYGTCHIAFGTNITFGGTIDAGVHLDAVTLTPTVMIDGKTIASHGQLRWNEEC